MLSIVQKPSDRQLQALSMAANGKSRDEIGRELFLAPRTVRQDLDDAREAVRARNVTHAVAICITYGYLVVEADEIAVAGLIELAVAV